eukprot:CAMPEP_0172631092 /NCGR_PEP_ID=MMETSP1068-20121228/177159_1 /TAXON_ID=35684 /ORGANISM="Pseudopedinella elastica, Strain CCMP716" /LENGTH=352 /DNA_ID=CAMNT_0013442121 /DNA_START=110 /DNA_END=1168 /DNA_ORIENTATION=+
MAIRLIFLAAVPLLGSAFLASPLRARGPVPLCVARRNPEPGDVVSLEDEDALMDLAGTSSYARAGAPKGVVMVVLYFSIMDSRQEAALSGLQSLGEAFPMCNFAKVAKEFGNSAELLESRLVKELPSVEVIAEGKRLSLTAGAEAGLEAAKRAIESFGFEARTPVERLVSFDLARPLGWTRATSGLAVTRLKEGGQAELLGVEVGDRVVAVEGQRVDTDAQFEAAMAAAREAQAQGGSKSVSFTLLSADAAPTSLAAEAQEAFMRAQARGAENTANFFMADGDTSASGNFQTWEQGAEAKEAATRLTSDFIPGGRALEEFAEKVVSDVEKLFTQESVDGEDEDPKNKKRKKN